MGKKIKCVILPTAPRHSKHSFRFCYCLKNHFSGLFRTFLDLEPDEMFMCGKGDIRRVLIRAATLSPE